MAEVLRAAWVIARRDYVATVLSRTFLLFLIGPLLPLIFGGIFGLASTQGAHASAPPPIAAILDAADARWLADAGHRIGGDPELRMLPPTGDEARQARALLGDGAPAVLAGDLDHPRLYARAPDLDDTADTLTPLLEEARDLRALADAHATPPAVTIVRHAIAEPAARAHAGDHQDVARGGQFVLILLTIMLAGMLLWNLLEEKSNKVLDILVSAVPVDAIFLGKLAAMLAMSLTFVAVWGTIAAIGLALVTHSGVLPPGLGIAPPAVGWPAFVALGIAYFTTSYLLLGAVFLGVGSQARTAREVQTLTLPATMGQVVVFGVASAAIGAPDGRLAWGAMLFPWSSPFAMFARAAELPQLWPHLLGLAWQALWIVLAVKLASRLFRRSVLNATPFIGRGR